MTNDRDSIAIIGLGKVGTAVGFLLRSSGYDIAAVSDTSEEALTRGVELTGGTPCADPSHAASLADAVIITTHDDAIKTACDRITADNAIKPGAKVIHMSGAGGLDLLESARDRGARTASIHPIQAFADVTSAIESIPGSTFGITAQDDMKEWAVRFVNDLDGTPFFVSETDKPLYHAAACIASNYLVTLMNIVVNVYQALGLSPEEAIKAFWPLVRGTVKNMEDHGPVTALTGPIARGDVGTISKHLHAFETKLPEILDIYRQLGVFTIEIGLKKQSLSEEKAEQIKLLLSGGHLDE
jgi:predicted short-subunit dehydrogenase-like oxidoreductase (DUF2520 family)